HRPLSPCRSCLPASSPRSLTYERSVPRLGGSLNGQAIRSSHQRRVNASRRSWSRRLSSRRCHHPNQNRPTTIIAVKPANEYASTRKAYGTSRMRPAPAYGSDLQHVGREFVGPTPCTLISAVDRHLTRMRKRLEVPG